MLNDFFTQYKKRVNVELEKLVDKTPTGSERLLSAMHYSLLSGGKRIRPILVYAASQAVSAETPYTPNKLTDSAACAVECIHAYSLIHDDLPAMDDDDLRRGEPTCHIQYDEATAILAGDALQGLAYETLSLQGQNTQQQLQLIRVLSKAAGLQGMVGGQAIDLSSVNQEIPLSTLESMHRHKTGALIEAAVVMGAISVSSPTPEQIEALKSYAQAIGLSFQVQDDILDVTADTATLGKQQGADVELNKPTYVKLLGLSAAKEKAQELHQQALDALSSFGPQADTLRALSAYIIKREF